MREKRSDVVVVGGGSAGLAAASRIAAEGYSVTILERENELGGILNQCIHNGFGLQRFKEDLTGPEYAERFIEEATEQSGIDVLLETTALEVSPGSVHTVYGYSRHGGVTRIDARAIVLAMGCRERNRGNIGIPGTRPSGVFTAGLAQLTSFCRQLSILPRIPWLVGVPAHHKPPAPAYEENPVHKLVECIQRILDAHLLGNHDDAHRPGFSPQVLFIREVIAVQESLHLGSYI